ncbi:MAG TPA: cell division protein FtsZ, partial [Acidimicrobiales bacterium]|nr:cell division protein FtsZ [Acidimicrobiales bacterium]
EAAEIIHEVAHPDANIIAGMVIDDAMGDEVRVTVIAAGFDRWDEGRDRERPEPAAAKPAAGAARGPVLGLGGRREREPERPRDDIFGTGDDDLELGSDDDDFDVPSFLK